MSATDAQNLLYLGAICLFVGGLVQMARPATARRGNRLAAGGMALAVAGTVVSGAVGRWPLVIVGVAAGTAAGIPAAQSVKMTAMPQMVALFNGVGGGAVALIAWAEFRGASEGLETRVLVPTLLAAMIGAVSFSGSLVAFGKLQGVLPGRPLRVPGGGATVGLLSAGALACGGLALGGAGGEWAVIGLIVLAGAAGIALVLPIGGADMPVVISLLNAFTGLSAAAYGLALDNIALIVAGALVGASGTILTRQMAAAMNRTLLSVIRGGFGGDGGPAAAEAGGSIRSTTPGDVAIQVGYSRRVLVVPGYGMAVAQAQHTVRELEKELERRGVEVYFGVHPVAGRMPGHMNVLLAEADVPYERLLEGEAANSEMARTDCALVIGANDVVNPAAHDDPGSPIFGMPIIDVQRARSSIVLKRSMAAGYSGVDNPLFADAHCQMLFGDARKSVAAVVEELRRL